jgi:hypothetical protein
VIDIANVTGAFYTNLMPEADALKLISKPAADSAQGRHLRRHRAASQRKAQRTLPGATIPQRAVPHLSQQKIDKLDFTGLRIRVTPVYKDIVEAMGGTR